MYYLYQMPDESGMIFNNKENRPLIFYSKSLQKTQWALIQYEAIGRYSLQRKRGKKLHYGYVVGQAGSDVLRCVEKVEYTSSFEEREYGLHYSLAQQELSEFFVSDVETDAVNLEVLLQEDHNFRNRDVLVWWNDDMKQV